ncbi:MAG: hypothetical protein MUO59_04170 [Actinobacteria bacterium]|nr:hypothetical protein [Actinomycetota bacterium]
MFYIIHFNNNSIISSIFVYPGEDELQAMADGVVLGLKGEIEVREYLSGQRFIETLMTLVIIKAGTI